MPVYLYNRNPYTYKEGLYIETLDLTHFTV